jgi:hypothetical protein
MAQLGYTWYPKDWFTSTTRKRLKRFPLVRYAMRELFDLMYMDGAPIEMNKEYLLDDLDIDLDDNEYEKLLEYVTIMEDGKWWINSVKKRITKAESARENGQKGGRPKTQKPSIKTQEQNPKNPSSERERESKREIETKDKVNIKIDTQISPYVFLKKENQSDLETFEMQNKKSFPDFEKFVENFNSKVIEEQLEFIPKILLARLRRLNTNWDKRPKSKSEKSLVHSGGNKVLEKLKKEYG